MLKETGNINQSLFTLGKVISALGGGRPGGKKGYIPYRDSKLTKLCPRPPGAVKRLSVP